MYVGRKDLRAKINGQLAELIDFEHGIQRALPDVTGVKVDVIKPRNHSRNLLVALLEMKEAVSLRNDVQRATYGLENRLATKLSTFTIPSVNMPIVCFPINVAGKIDPFLILQIERYGFSVSSRLARSKL